MGGTRYNARGIDDDGNVANHAEFEQILWVDDPLPTSHNEFKGKKVI